MHQAKQQPDIGIPAMLSLVRVGVKKSKRSPKPVFFTPFLTAKVSFRCLAHITTFGSLLIRYLYTCKAQVVFDIREFQSSLLPWYIKGGHNSPLWKPESLLHHLCTKPCCPDSLPSCGCATLSSGCTPVSVSQIFSSHPVSAGLSVDFPAWLKGRRATHSNQWLAEQ